MKASKALKLVKESEIKYIKATPAQRIIANVLSEYEEKYDDIDEGPFDVSDGWYYEDSDIYELVNELVETGLIKKIFE